MHADLLTATHVFFGLLVAASLTAICTRFVRMPYSVALVFTGLGLNFFDSALRVQMTPELVMVVFLPGLLFEAAWNVDLKALRDNWLPITAMATIGVLLCTALVGIVLVLLGGFDWKLAFVFGAMVAATDPASVVTMFRKLGVPKRLTTLLEGESLLNDGTAVVVFRIACGMVLSGTSLSFLDTATTMATVIAGGMIVGLSIGVAVSWLTRLLDDHALEITVTVIAAYGTYFLSEQVQVSPVIAVVSAGLVVGNYGSRVGMTPTTRLSITAFWEYMAFLANSVLFILVGSTIEIDGLMANSRLILIAVLAVLIARAVAVYGLSGVCARRDPIPLPWQHVIFWGGLRGALCMALALSLPLNFPHRLELLHMTFGVVLFTLLVKGLTIELLVRFLKLRLVDPLQIRYQALAARLMCVSEEERALHRLRSARQIGPDTFDKVLGALKQTHDRLDGEMSELKTKAPRLQEYEELRTLQQLAALRKERLRSLFKDGQINEEQLSTMIIETDQQLERQD